uniref:CDP-diacylglycerol--glycerol-3-phosphate 3-phosphatidyltransferase 2 n=1 Tax=Zea mays TaxID=4577 RepID=A0A804PUA9_MAIZE
MGGKRSVDPPTLSSPQPLQPSPHPVVSPAPKTEGKRGRGGGGKGGGPGDAALAGVRFWILMAPCLHALAQGPWAAMAKTGIFLAAAVTDWLDGYIARKMQLGTPFGAFLDPVADKLMVAATLVLLCTKPLESSLLNDGPWLLTVPSIAIIGREALPSSGKEAIELLDILLRWIVLRFCESNTTCLLKVLDFLLELFDILKDQSYMLTEAEAAIYLPCLIMKSRFVARNQKITLMVMR